MRRLALLSLAGVLALALVTLVSAVGIGSSRAQLGAMQNCPQSGKWAITVWSGEDRTDTAEALATCGSGVVDAAYWIDPQTQVWLRWFKERPDLSNLTTLDAMQGIIATSKFSQTQVNVIQPSALFVIQETEGHCWVGALTTMRPDAWRCMEGNLIRDPCFSESDMDAFVICPTGHPQDMTGVKMNLTEPLPLSYGHDQEDRSYAWVLELADGATCGFITGATGVIDGERVNYMCSDGWWIVGFPEIDAVWTVRKVLMSASFDQPIADAEVAVVTAWR
jgi:hypothetical protein